MIYPKQLIEFCDFPPEVLQRMSDAFSGLERISPPWCQAISVEWVNNCETTTNDSVMTCRSDYDYRRAVIEVYPIALQYTTAELREVAIHEVIHISLAPMFLMVQSEFERADDGLYKKLLNDIFTSANEQTTQDLTYIVSKLLDG